MDFPFKDIVMVKHIGFTKSQEWLILYPWWQAFHDGSSFCPIKTCWRVRWEKIGFLQWRLQQRERRMTMLETDEHRLAFIHFGFFFPSSAFLLSISLILLTLSLFFFAHLSLPSLWALWTHWRSVFCLTICLALSPVLRLGPVNKQGGVDVKKEGRKLGSIKWKKRERRAFWRDGGRGAGCDWRPGEKGTALKKFPYLFNPQSCLNI